MTEEDSHLTQSPGFFQALIESLRERGQDGQDLADLLVEVLALELEEVGRPADVEKIALVVGEVVHCSKEVSADTQG